MSVSISTYSRGHLEEMTVLYNSETADQPHIAPLNPERFIEFVESKSAFQPSGLFVARERGNMVGWIHACLAPGSEAHHRPENRYPRIRMLIYRRERLEAGRILVREATRWLRMQSDDDIEAMHAKHGYPFYRGLWLGCEPMAPATMAHVHLALEVGGYRTTQESVFMTARMASRPRETTAQIRLDLVATPAEMRHAGVRESWTGFEPMRIRAIFRREEAGSVGWALLPHLTETLGSPGMNIWTLGVREGYRRKGVASALVSRAMGLAYDLGARFASVGTQLWNVPAHATYAKFEFVPSVMMVGRETLPTQEIES